ncbi:MAG: glycerol-3-phosphate dehydrogenase/oxidase [Bryobacterales bacterium]|nr:glycerol-3-phosphate dehydrogenase/oxidase [Bryobacterales bacterium]
MTAEAPRPAFTRASRPDALKKLKQASKQNPLDVLVIGGGINGAGILRDLAQRASDAKKPLRLALVEKRHFASGTSSRNSQLLHGGLRYLKNFEFKLVKEALRERAALKRIAPHLVDPLPFLIPFHGVTDRLMYGTGLMMYDLLAGADNIGRRAFLTREQASALEPGLNTAALTSAGVYYDCKVESARLVLENIFDAVRLGAAAMNYLEALEWRLDGGDFRVKMRERFSGEEFAVHARRIVDARGPWDGGGNLRLVRGSHLIYPKLSASDHAIAHFHTDGRIFFVIPWGPNNTRSLVGTTDADHAGPADEVKISAEEVRYIREVAAAVFPHSSGIEPIAAYSSLRPLVKSEQASATKTSREHRIFEEPPGVVRITGGKYTTYRLMSAEAADMAWPELAGACRTAAVALGGNTPEAIASVNDQVDVTAARTGIYRSDVAMIAKLFGVQAPGVLGRAPAEGASDERALTAVLDWTLEHEMIERMPDFLFVSTHLGHEERWDERLLAHLASDMGSRLGWDANRRKEEVALALQIVSMPRA